MTGAHASAPSVTYALAHALWQGAALAALAALWPSRSAARRHAIGLAALAAMVIAPIVTFAIYRRAPVVELPIADLPGPVLIRGTGWLALIAPIVWLAGAAALAARQLVSWSRVRRLGQRGAAPGLWVLRIDQLRRRLAIVRPVAVRTLAAGAPFTAFARRPCVWLPPLWAALPDAQRDALAAHELAHVRRLDWIWNGVQSALEAALWFHPAAWWLGRRVRDDREHACDDLAVAVCGDPIVLAEALVALERGAPARLALAARGGHLLARTRRLLGGSPPPVRVPLAVIGALALGLGLASQLVLPRDMLLGLRVDASTHGPLTPGAYRDITADALGGHHHYHGSMDAHGGVRERYEQDGQPRPIDPVVRAWLAELIAIDAR